MNVPRAIGKVVLSFILASWSEAATLAAPSETPKLPFYDWGACPFECCTYRGWTTTAPVDLLAKPSPHSPLVTHVEKNKPVLGLTGVVITTRYGVTRVLAPMMMGLVPNSKNDQPQIAAKSGTLVYTLHYDGEGYTRFWYNGRMYTDQIDASDHPRKEEPFSPSLRMLSRPKSDWWVKVKTRDGKIGWTKETGRFDNMDACG
jgi:hypothetical protein